MKIKTFTVSYGAKTFSGMIKAGTFEATGTHISTVQSKAMEMIVEHFDEDYDEDDVFSTRWFFDLQNISITVTENL